MPARPPTKSTASTDPTRAFRDQPSWGKWLATHHAKSTGLWLKLAKKSTGIKSVTYAEAVEEALIWGWIDGHKRPLDQDHWLQRFTPRGPRSVWSKINCGKVEALMAAGKLQPPGLAAVQAAKANGRWEAAYDSPSTAKVPPDFQAALDANPKASAFYTINAANRYAMLYRVQSAKKPETRAKHIARFIEMLTAKQTLHPVLATKGARTTKIK